MLEMVLFDNQHSTFTIERVHKPSIGLGIESSSPSETLFRLRYRLIFRSTTSFLLTLKTLSFPSIFFRLALVRAI
jgi:hypothetical protein